MLCAVRVRWRHSMLRCAAAPAAEVRSGALQSNRPGVVALSPSAHGAPVEWDAGPGSRSGTTAGLAEDGALLARTADGLERIVSGEVRWM